MEAQKRVFYRLNEKFSNEKNVKGLPTAIF